jgi:hypothetical protein
MANSLLVSRSAETAPTGPAAQRPQDHAKREASPNTPEASMRHFAAARSRHSMAPRWILLSARKTTLSMTSAKQ